MTAEIRDCFTLSEKTPDLVTRIGELKMELIHSAALLRTGLWPIPAFPERVEQAKIGLGHIKINKKGGMDGAPSPDQIKQKMQQDYKDNLY